MPKNHRILVVEDDRAVRDLLRLHLENAGYHVVALPDAVAAGKHVLGDPASIHLLIVDANLPYMSGIEFASALIADTALPFIPMILITGHEHLADRAGILGVPCLVKPFTADALIQLVEQTLAAARTQSSAGIRDHCVAPLAAEPGRRRA